MAETRTYTTEAIAVHWDASRCIHTARCIAGLPGVFDPRRRPWIDLDETDADEVAAVVTRCPTGALHFQRRDGGPDEQAVTPPIVMPAPNGPLFVRGHVQIVNGAGEVLREDTRMALCRCGASENKPFCDNSHRRIGFRAP